MMRSFLCILIVATIVSASDECDASNDEGLSCAAQQDEASLGLDALPARIAVVSGQTPDPPICGNWCEDNPASGPATPCRMDRDVVPCETDFYCTTTCALWTRMTDTSKRPTVSCPMFSRFDGYPAAAEPCDESCLLPEIRKGRYPQPTGVGLLCQPGTCNPSSSSMSHLPDVVGILECPCSWFGSDCPDDWAPIEAVNHTSSHGDGVVATTLKLSREDLERIVSGHRPGGVVRVVHRDRESGRVREQPYAVAYASPGAGTLEILTAPPDRDLHPVAREVAERVRSLPSGLVVGGNLFVNPSIAGFFNKRWTFLLDAVVGSGGGIDRLVVMSTGAGLSGALSAVEAALPLGLRGVHLYHGLRRAQDLPYRNRLNELMLSRALDLAIIQSSDSVGSNHDGIAAALRRGAEARKLSPVTKLVPLLPGGGSKVYVQHAVGLDLTSVGGSLHEKGVILQNTAFVACGRMALLEESFDILEKLLCSNETGQEECRQRLETNFFTNI